MSGSKRVAWPIMLAVAGLVFLVFAVATLIGGFGGWSQSFEGPGETAIELPSAGDYRLWHVSEAFIDGRMHSVDDQLPGGTTLEFRDEDDRKLQLEPASGSMRIESGSTRRVALGQLQVDRPGVYTATVSGIDERRRFRLSEIRFMDHLLRALGLGFVGTVLVLAAVAWAIVLTTRSSRAAA